MTISSKKIVLPLWIVGASLLLVATLFSGPVYRSVRPAFTPVLTATEYEQLANTVPPSARMAKRYRAIAEALRIGATTYTYEMDQTPMTGPVPPEQLPVAVKTENTASQE